MEKFQVEVEVVTPMFIAGSDMDKIELRPSSVKGVLRWWWRALNGNLTIDELKKKEGEIFGSTEKRSSFALQIEPYNIPYVHNDLPKGMMVRVEGKAPKASIIHYLAFGLSDSKKNLRPHIKEGTKFSIKFIFYNDTKDDVLTALYYMLKHGGLGAKTRNGMGCLNASGINDLKRKTFPQAGLKDYTTLSRETKLYKFDTHKTWVDALSEIGNVYRNARLSLENRHCYDKRVLVAMPIVKDKKTKDNRHSKPFLLHVNKVGHLFQGEILYMPHAYYNNYFTNTKRVEYKNVMKSMCTQIQMNAKEVTDAL